ncbi:hypothetical protein [Shewanella aestuarii]|uniref:Uncharacterized protein n=1 Tax=Shewanella aestuarii TaxID=1028752 RepID=A0A6G9QRS0_9GAMM|nr:hypothetical protein [Shewanella aestuarii]QIR16491.1 hypothetical protein HBH39_18620 [Shewanella aestuarii]
MEKLLQLIATMGIQLDDSFNGVYVIEENDCRLSLDNWIDDEDQRFSIEYIDPAIEQTIFELTINEHGEFIEANYAGDKIEEDDFENELEERFNWA